MAERESQSIHEKQTSPSVEIDASSHEYDGMDVRRIGPFRIIKTIGSGGMGVVYEALRDHPRQTVAIKLLKHGIGSEMQRERFKRESEFLATLHHSHIAQLYDVGMLTVGDETMPYFVMELVESGMPITLHAKKEKLSIRERIELFLSVCDAVQHGHDKGILHRDLKPENILVDAQGQVKIIDFGVARVIGEEDESKRYTSTGQFVGTVQYMSPEQVQTDSSKLDVRSDVYSLGVVLFELLTEQLPYKFPSKSLLEAARVIRESAPKVASDVAPELKGPLDAILLKGLSKSRNSRYASVADFQHDLELFLKKKRVNTGKISKFPFLQHVVTQFILSHPIVASLVTFVLAFLIAEFIGVPLIYKWTPVQKGYLSAITSLAPLSGADGPYDDVRVIKITDETAALMPTLADEAGVSGFDHDVWSNDGVVDSVEWKRTRMLHGALMNRLADAGVGVLAFDLSFKGAPVLDEEELKDLDEVERKAKVEEAEQLKRTLDIYDTAMVDGLKTLTEAGTPVVVAVPTWSVDEKGYPDLSRNILPHVRWGCTSAWFFPDGPWEIESVIYKPAVGTIGSFDMEIMAAHWYPNWMPEYSIETDGEFAATQIDFYQPVQDSDVLRRSLGESRRIGLSSVWLCDLDDSAVAIFVNDLVGYYGFPIPPTETLESCTYSYEWTMRASPEELRSAFDGKIVLIGDLRDPEKHHLSHFDFHETPDGRLLHGVYGHAAVLQSMLHNNMIYDERQSTSRLGIAALALVGLVIAWFGAGRPARRIVLFLAVAATLAGAAYFLYSDLHYIFNPIIPFLAALLSGEIGARIIQMRRSYFA